MNAPAKVAVVTGGGSGIGRACAEALANEHFRVVCCGLERDADASSATEFVRLDVTDERAVGEFAAA
jgi:NAD(P)-dependent dehydrogenase (short-subunit alcohol dehydrogenase family)